MDSIIIIIIIIKKYRIALSFSVKKILTTAYQINAACAKVNA